MFWHSTWDGPFLFPWMWLFPLICFIVFLFILRGPSWMMFGGRSDREDTPRNILDKRLARGEISREEYAQLRKDIG